MTDRTHESPERTVEEQLAAPPLARLVGRHPSIRTAVVEVLEAAGAVRLARPAALPAGPSATPSPAWNRAKVDLEAAVSTLAQAAATPDIDSDSVTGVIDRVTLAVMEMRVQSHAFSPPRVTGGRAARVALIQAIRRFSGALGRLHARTRDLGVTRLPWQIEFATHIEPGTAESDLELSGYDLPGTPVATLPWGDRCVLTGESFTLESRRAPAIRYRSLDSCSSVLAPTGFEIVRRIREALELLGRSHPAAVRRLLDLAPWIAETYLPWGSNPTLTRLGLLDFPSLAVSVNNLLRSHADLPLLGSQGEGGSHRHLGARDRAEVILSRVEPGFGWTTNDEIRNRALELAHGLESLGVRTGSRLGIVATENCAEFLVTDVACVFSNIVTVGVLDTLADEALLEILRVAEIETIVTDAANAHRFTTPQARERCPKLAIVIVFGSSNELPANDSGGLRVVAMEQALAPVDAIPEDWASASGIGFSTPVIHDDQDGAETARGLAITQDSDDDVFTLVFTSGSTGNPKGVVVTRRQWTEVMRTEGGLWPHIEISYLPSAMAADRTVVWRTLAAGGRVGFGGRGAGLLADLESIRPTILEAPPAILNALYGEYRLVVSDPNVGREQLAAIRRRMRNDLGGRLAFLATGGAASEPTVREVLGDVLGLPISEGYGTTETGTIAADGHLKPEVDFRLVDVPDMDFTSADRPHPRGELAVRTPRTTARYFAAKTTDQTAFTDDGYFLTGDIVELRGPRQIRIIGRRKQFFKLAGAEFVYPDLLERHFIKSDLIRSVLVTGLPTEHAVVAIVVPAGDGIDDDQILRTLRTVARNEGLRPFEVPVGLIVEPQADGELPWTAENGLLTPSLKLNRRALETYYGDRIREVYADAASRMEVLEDDGRDQTDRHRGLIRHLVANLLRVHPSEIDLEGSFDDHGGGSLAAMELVLRLRQLLPPGGARRRANDPAVLTGTPLGEVAGWLGGPAEQPSAPLAGVSATQETPAETATARPAAPTASRHRVDVLHANADAAWCEVPDPLPPPSTGTGILLTGATGFLGIHMVAELAASLARGQRLFTLIRADNDEAARRRLEAALGHASLEVPPVAAGPNGRGAVVALAGSLERDRFGLDPEVYSILASEVGLIYHSGAAVSFEQGYEGLRDVNVGGTRRVLELATDHSLKAVHFVSSLNVAFLLENCGVRPAREDSTLPTELPPAIVAKSLGYAITKWASERMVQGVFAAAGGRFQASISRPALITWSSATGFANESDWFTRMIRSCLEMGAAVGPSEAGIPRWVEPTSTTARGLDLVPVDFVARATCRLGELTQTGMLPSRTEDGISSTAPTYHISNLAPNEHGLVTIERLMDMVVAADLRSSTPPRNASFVPFSDWLLKVEAEGAPALPILPMLMGMNPNRPRTQADRFAEAMAIPTGAGPIECPAFSQKVVDIGIRRMRQHERDGC
jgi:thioester reductase-like protein